MTPSQCVELCRYVRGAVPHQQWDATTPDVWFDLGLSEWTLADALAAVRVMVRGRVFVDFNGIVETIRKLRNERAQGADRIDPPPVEELDPDDWRAFMAWQRGTTRAVASGELEVPASEPHPAISPQMLALLSSTGRRIPRRGT